MIEPAAFDHDRTVEIIAAYGADSTRWPDAERAMALGVVAADHRLAVALDAARALDADLAEWARRPVPAGDAITAAAVAMRRPRHFTRWAAGGGIAASLAAAIVLLAPMRITPSTAVVAAAVAPVSDEAAFAQVFTPTPDEERIL